LNLEFFLPPSFKKISQLTFFYENRTAVNKNHTFLICWLNQYFHVVMHAHLSLNIIKVAKTQCTSPKIVQHINILIGNKHRIFLIRKMGVKLSNFIIVHKYSPSGFRTHDLSHTECCLLPLDQQQTHRFEIT
jgi:hypothetical protein